jgi:hypothetical protein
MFAEIWIVVKSWSEEKLLHRRSAKSREELYRKREFAIRVHEHGGIARFQYSDLKEAAGVRGGCGLMAMGIQSFRPSVSCCLCGTAQWRQWKTPRRRRTALLKLGVLPRLASDTASSRRGPWPLVRTKALTVGLSNACFKSRGLPTLVDECSRNRLEPSCTDPYARWCGRGERVTAAPIPIKSSYGMWNFDL